MSDQEPFADPVAELQAFLDGQQRKEDALRAELLALQDQTRRAKRAIEVLTDRKINQAKKPPSGGYAWTPRQNKLDDTLRALGEGARTIQEVAAQAEMSTETARRALKHLRETERVRMTGTISVGRNNQKVETFALMPTAVVSDAA